MRWTDCRRGVALGAALLLLGASRAPAQDKLAKDVAAAVDRGVKALRQIQQEDGSFLRGRPGDEQTVGATALAGLTLLECGAPPTDKAVEKAAAAVRKAAPTLTFTYAAALTVMFLDRLGDAQDVPLIEAIAVRLLAGQDQGVGVWSYHSPTPEAPEVERLTKVVEGRKNEIVPLPKGKPRTVKDLPKEIRDRLAEIPRMPPAGDGGLFDNSNTQFAILGLWVARRHGLPVERALKLADDHFRRTQRTSGGWSYSVPPLKADKSVLEGYEPTAAMTCTGLIGLALGHGASASKKNLTDDSKVKIGLQAVSTFIGEPGKPDRAGDGKELFYFLWTLERTAVLYDLKTIGGKDWFAWGAETILARQQADGTWQGKYAEGGCDTCFALLYLRRANLAHDLTERIKGKQTDPGRPPPKLLEMIEKEFKDPKKKSPEPEPESRAPARPGPAVGEARPSVRATPAPAARRFESLG